MPDIRSILLGAAGALMLTLCGLLALQHWELKNAQTKYNDALMRTALLENDNANFKQLAERQNDWIARLRTAQAAKAEAAAKAVEAARKNAEAYSALAARIEAQKLTGDDCENARAVLHTYLKNQQ